MSTDKKCFDCQVNGRDCWHMKQASTDLDAQLDDWIDNYGLCDLMSYEADEFKTELKKRIADREREARIDERRTFIEADEHGKNAIYIAKQKQLHYHDHQFSLISYKCDCGISQAEAQSLDRLAELTKEDK